MRVFKYRGGDWGTVKRDLRSLVKNQIYAASFSQLNDPFEGIATYDNKSFELGRLLFGSTDSLYTDQQKRRDTQFQEVLKEFKEFCSGVGIYSLSKSSTDELMWAHYANSHQGFCMEFDIDKLIEYKLVNELVVNVEYSSNAPIAALEGFLAPSDHGKSLLSKLVGSKSLRWKHEEEIRIVTGTAGEREYDYRALKAIYFGLHSSDRLIKLTMRLLRGRGLKYYKMETVDGSYELSAIRVDDGFPDFPKYRDRIAQVDKGLPNLDDRTRPFETELRRAIDLTRKDPYCELVKDAYISSNHGTKQSPVFYVSYDRSDGAVKNLYYSLEELRI